jgi:zinc transport system permease protein
MFNYEFMQNAMLAAILISILCPLIGIFLVLKRHSMMSDTLAHSSLAGVALGIVSGFNPILSAFLFTSICGIIIELMRKYYKKYEELILIIVLSFSLGTAITIISSGKVKTNVNSYLFGSILTISKEELYSVLALSIISIIVVLTLYNQLLYIVFDEEGAKIAGIKVKLVNYIFAILVAAAISVTIRIVGVLVLTTMITLPVTTALQLNKGFKKTLVFSIAISMIDIISGLFISYYSNTAAGGMIALTSVAMLILVMIFKKLYYIYIKSRMA